MSYVDRYAIQLREAADRRGRPRRFRRHAPRLVAVTALSAAAVAVVAALSGLRSGEQAVAPGPEDPRVAALVDAVFNGDRSRQPACRAPRGRPSVSDAPLAPATLKAFGVFRRPENAPPALVRTITRGGAPGVIVMRRSIRALPYESGRPRAVVFVQRGAWSHFVPRDVERCAELLSEDLERRAAREPEAIAAAAREALRRQLERQRKALASDEDRLFLTSVSRGGRVLSGGGGATAEQVRRTGMGGTATHRDNGRVTRAVSGLAPDGVAEVEIVARGAGKRPWVRRHRVRVRDNYFHLDGLRAASFRVRWLDARGREIDRG